MATFPDATIVMTHRDPLSVIQSAATMIAYSARIKQEMVDPPAIGRYWVDRIETMLRAAVRDRHLIPEDRVEHVEFSAFMDDQLGTVERIYERHGMSFEAQKPVAEAYVRDHPRGEHGSARYDLATDFDLDPSAVRERFTFYRDSYPHRIEVR